MRGLACVLLLLVPVVFPATPAGVAGKTELRITVWPQGRAAGGLRAWTLRCAPAGGTLPNARRTCTRLLRLERPFASTPRDVACTQVYGGPQVAVVRGMFRGDAVRAAFNRANGCEIARWQRVRFLFPVPVGLGQP